jgi:hypothetical protein
VSVRWADEALQQGFTQVPNAVLLDPRLSAGARLVFAVLCHYAREKDSCFPGQARMAEQVGAKERAVRTKIRELEEAGLVTTEQRGLGKTNRYLLHLPDRSKSTGLTGRKRPTEVDTEEEDAVSPPKGSSRSKQRAEDVQVVFDHWKRTFGKNANTLLNKSRRGRISARLREGYTPERLMRAIEGATRDDWLMGRAVGARAQGWKDLDTILRDGPQVERLEELADQEPAEDWFETLVQDARRAM